MNDKPSLPTRPNRSALTILELLVTMAVSSVLMALLVPSLHAAREAARRVECVNHLKEIGLALHSYHDLHGGLPAGWQPDFVRKTAFGWAAALLPHLDEPSLAAQIDFRNPVDADDYAIVRQTTPAVFLCPSDLVEPTFDLFEQVRPHRSIGIPSANVLVRLPSANYVGVFGTSDPDDVAGTSGEGTFFEGRSIRFVDLQRGLSNTVIVGERTARRMHSTWFGIDLKGEDAHSLVVGNADKGPNQANADECEFDSRHPGCANFLWADGHVEPISDSINSATYQALARRRASKQLVVKDDSGAAQEPASSSPR